MKTFNGVALNLVMEHRTGTIYRMKALNPDSELDGKLVYAKHECDFDKAFFFWKFQGEPCLTINKNLVNQVDFVHVSVPPTKREFWLPAATIRSCQEYGARGEMKFCVPWSLWNVKRCSK